MAEIKKTTGEPIDDEALDGVVGGRGSYNLTNRNESPGTEEPLNSDEPRNRIHSIEFNEPDIFEQHKMDLTELPQIHTLKK